MPALWGLRSVTALSAIAAVIVGASTAYAATEDNAPPSETARRPRTPPPPPTPPVNPNLAEWTLINLTSTDLASASGGSGVKVAVLDGMTDCAHADLAGRCTVTLISGGSYRQADSHGTHTAGIVASNKYGIATGATVLNYAVFDRLGWVATGTKLSDAWVSAYNAGARISSMSFGCTRTALCFTASELTTMANPSLPMLYVKAAGNDGAVLGNESTSANVATASAALDRTLLVGSVNASGVISSFSNRPGEGCLVSTQSSGCAEDMKWKYHFIVAPGEAIYSTLPGGSYGYMSGTSMATPVVAGAAALLQQRWPALKATPEVLAEILLTTATDKGAAGVDGVYGYGLLNVAAAFQANGTVSMIGSTGGSVSISAVATYTSPMTSRLGEALANVTVYDRFGRDFTLAETGALRVAPNALTMRQLLGRRLAGANETGDWANSFFGDEYQPRGFAFYGSRSDPAGSLLGFDQSARIGVDLPFNGGVAQFRLMGAGDARIDLAHDATMRPLAHFASTGLLRGAMISNALIRLPGRNRLMAYAIATPGAVNARLPYDPFEMRLTPQGLLPRAALSGSHKEIVRQTGVGAGFWTQPDRHTVIGVNLSAVRQKGGYYSLVSDLSDFNRPTQMFNFGVAASRQFGDWELSASGELTHLRTSAGAAAIHFRPGSLVSAEIGLRKSNVAFSSGGISDSFGMALVVPPRAVSGSLQVDYMTRTADGLGMQAARLNVPLAELGQEPPRVEAAYRIGSGDRWSFNLSGGLNLAKADGLGAGEGMASFTLGF